LKRFVRNFFGFVLGVEYVGDLYDDVFSVFVAVLKHFVSLLALDISSFLECRKLDGFWFG
jgi:hypothetical protein